MLTHPGTLGDRPGKPGTMLDAGWYDTVPPVPAHVGGLAASPLDTAGHEDGSTKLV